MTFDTSDTRSDLHLLELSRKGDRDAFGQLIGKHYQNCIRAATCVLRDPTEAEDQVQQASRKAFEHLHQYLGEAEFSSWLLHIVLNECRMALRSRKRAHFVYFDHSCDGRDRRPMELPEPASDPENEAIKNNIFEVLRTEIRHIPPLFKQVILLRDIEGLTMPDVAHRLGITLPAAKSRLIRARGELRQRIIRRFGPGEHMMLLSTAGTFPARPRGAARAPAYHSLAVATSRLSYLPKSQLKPEVVP